MQHCTWYNGDVLGDSVLQAPHDAGDVGTVAKAVIRVVVPIHRVPSHHPRPCINGRRSHLFGFL